MGREDQTTVELLSGKWEQVRRWAGKVRWLELKGADEKKWESLGASGGWEENGNDTRNCIRMREERWLKWRTERKNEPKQDFVTHMEHHVNLTFYQPCYYGEAAQQVTFTSCAEWANKKDHICKRWHVAVHSLYPITIKDSIDGGKYRPLKLRARSIHCGVW